MRNIFKTSYVQDIRLFEHSGHVFWYGLLLIVVFAAPLVLPQFFVGEMSLVFIYAVAGIGLMILTGFTGLASLGHAAFLGIGAYAHNYFVTKVGVPFPFALVIAGFVSAGFGIAFALPALRMTGIYLAIATLAFNVIVEEIITRWDAVTGGSRGMHLKAVQLFGYPLTSDASFYYLCLALTALACLALINILRSPTGRAFVAIRDSEISASCMGVNLAKYKTMSFALSAALTGVGGALYAHKVAFITPEQFTLLTSIELVTIVIIGGIGSLHGAVLGAAFIIVLPQLISMAKDFLPEGAPAAGVQSVVFGLILITFIIFEPLGLYGRWIKIRTYFQVFPFYRRGTFQRQRAYLKSERLR